MCVCVCVCVCVWGGGGGGGAHTCVGIVSGVGKHSFRIFTAKEEV